MSFPLQPLRHALYERLAGTDGQGLGLSESVYVAGAVPTDEPAPYVVIERPRNTGANFIGGRERFDVRIALRVHTRFPPGQANADQADTLAEAVHDSLTGAALAVNGYRDATILTPNVQPVGPYPVGELQAYDLNLRYTFRFSN